MNSQIFKMDEKLKNLLLVGAYATDEEVAQAGCFAIVIFLIIAIAYGIYRFWMYCQG